MTTKAKIWHLKHKNFNQTIDLLYVLWFRHLHVTHHTCDVQQINMIGAYHGDDIKRVKKIN